MPAILGKPTPVIPAHAGIHFLVAAMADSVRSALGRLERYQNYISDYWSREVEWTGLLEDILPTLFAVRSHPFSPLTPMPLPAAVPP